MSGIRLTLELSLRADGHLERLAEKRQTTKARVLRGALTLLFAVDAAKQAGFHVGAWKEEPGLRTEREFVLP